MTRKEQEQLTRKEYIIDAAAELFSKDGYDKTSMNEIAKKAEFTKRTIYQYFEDKADLFLSVLIKYYKKMSNELKHVEYNKTEGLDIFRQMLFAQYEYYKNNRGTFRMMYEIGKVRMLTNSPKVDIFLQIDTDITDSLVSLIELGQQDGTISNKKNALKTALNLKFFTTAVFDKLVTTSEYYTKHIGVTVDEFAHSLLEQIVDSVRP